MATREQSFRLDDGLGLGLVVGAGDSLVDLTERLRGLCEDVAAGSGRSVVVLRLASQPDAVREWPGPVGVQDVNRWERTLRRLTRLPTGIISVAEGTCAGAGLDLLLASDFRLCTADVRLLLPVNDGHFWPGTAVHALVQQVGLAVARRIVLWGEDLTAEEAVRIGLVDQVTTDLEAAVHEATFLLGRISDRELAVRRALLADAVTSTIDDALGIHLAACDRELRRLQAVDAAAGGDTQ